MVLSHFNGGKLQILIRLGSIWCTWTVRETGGRYTSLPIMLSREQIEEYRRMTPGERISLSLRMAEEQWPQMVRGPTEVVDRRFELLNRENDARNRNMLAALARSGKNDDSR